LIELCGSGDSGETGQGHQHGPRIRFDRFH
jgi:hypothetical protein